MFTLHVYFVSKLTFKLRTSVYLRHNVYIIFECYTKYSTVPGILFYTMPVGQSTKNGKVTFQDASYNGVIANGVYKDGTGILTDGKFGPDNPKQDKGKGWVGWSSNLTTSPYVNISFEFSSVRKFKDVTLTVNIDKKRSYAVFDRSEIFFALSKDNLINTSFFEHCPIRNFSDSNAPAYSANITLSLCENTARFIKLRLYFGGRWLLITEISFNSGILLITHPICNFNLLSTLIQYFKGDFNV